MSRARKIIIAILVACVLVGAAVGLSAWRRSVTASQSQPATTSARPPQTSQLPQSLSQTVTQTVTDFETNARQWGVSRFDQQSAQAMTINQAITHWRVSDDGGLPSRRTALEQLIRPESITLHEVQETDPAWQGTSLYTGYADYWAKQLYTIGINIEPGSLQVTKVKQASDGTISVTVSLRQQVIVYTPPAKDALPEGSWTFAPSIGYYDCEDHLTLSDDGKKVVQLPDGNLSGPWFLSPLIHGWKKADSGFTGLSGATDRHDQSVTYQGDDFRNVQTGLYPDPLFMGSGSTAQQPAPDGTGKHQLKPGELPPEG